MNYTRIVSLTFLLLVIGPSWFILPTQLFLKDLSQENSNINQVTEGVLISKSKNEEYIPPFIDENVGPSYDLSWKNSPKDTISQSVEKITQTPAPWRLFWVYNVEETVNPNSPVYDEVNATLKIIGPYCLIYSAVTPGFTHSLPDSVLQDINQSFSTTIYPTLVNFLGNPPDIDSNAKIILLFLDIQDPYGGLQYVAGFFDPQHELPKSPQNPKSEESEILFIDGKEGFTNLVSENYDVIAHELQHLIHFGHDEDENIWLDEGISMFSEYLIGINPPINKFELKPYVSLTYWDYSDEEGLVLSNYAAAYTFIRYLAEKYGGSIIIEDIVSKTTNGITSIEESLTNHGYQGLFEEVFRNWTIANYVDNPLLNDGMYGYENLTMVMTAERSYFNSPVARTENSVPYWGTDYLEFDFPNELPFNLEFQGDVNVDFLVTAILMNTSTIPLNTLIIPIDISNDGFANFSSTELNISADKITLVISSYINGLDNNYDNYNPAPAQTYWYMVNPAGIFISAENLTLSNDKNFLNVFNITVADGNGFIWQDADIATYEILTNLGESSGIKGNMLYNSISNYWEALNINITNLTDGDYKLKFNFLNETSSGIRYSQLFTISRQTTNTTSSVSWFTPNFLLVLTLISIALLIINRKKN